VLLTDSQSTNKLVCAYIAKGNVPKVRPFDAYPVLCLHLLQSALVYVNTLMIQRVLREKQWRRRLKPEDLRALTPLIYLHVNPYGEFKLDMGDRIQIESM
jgi:hypothetical protein